MGPTRIRPSAGLVGLVAAAFWALAAADVVAQGSEESDRAALAALYDATGGAGWANSTNWRTSAPLGEWYGVSADPNGRVTALSLNSNGLAGSIAPEVGKLVHLRSLSLGWNELTGPVPAWLRSLTQLQRLELEGNALTGPIPVELGSLANLEFLSLGGNELTGPVPAWLGNLPRLRSLNLRGAGLSGPIPVELGSLANLEYLSLGWNELTGPVPAWLGNLPRLRSLYLSGAGLSGPIPVELGSLANLEDLYLGWNELTGPVPAWLGNLPRLRSLSLGPGLSGPIPVELGSLANLEDLSLGGNELTGPVPAWLGNLPRLRSLYLEGTGLSGPIPVELGSLANLEELSLGRNELTGPIPVELGSLANLGYLYLGGNELTGPIPVELGSLANLGYLYLGGNELTGPIPAELGNLENLEHLGVDGNDLTGPIPVELGNLLNLQRFNLAYNWGLTGPLPAGLEQSSSLEELDFFVTQTCAPAAWQEWLATIEGYGPLCEAGTDVTIDTVVVYTPAALEAAGGAAAIEAEIDLMIAVTNEAYAASGVSQRLALVARSEVPYTETNGSLDIRRLTDPSDGHLDEAHALRDATGADVVHLIVGAPYYNFCGIANLPGPFGITLRDCGGLTFAHELGHNMGLRHDRFQVELFEGSVSSHPAYGYANQRVFTAGAPQSSRWVTIMSYRGHCFLADVTCSTAPRFSNPRQRYGGDPLGIPFGRGSGVTGPADAASVLDATGPAVAAWRDRPADATNRPPAAVGALPDRRLGSVGSELDVDVSQAFVDPDGDALSWTVSSAAPWVVRAAAAGARVTLAAVSEGAATIRVTATDPGGLSVSRSFSATVEGAGDTDPPGSVESDRAALEALYDATGGAGWTDSTNWKTSAPLGEWHGVTTDAAGRVTEVNLFDNALAGWLPPALGNLAHLESLRLGRNALTGPIPVALGSLASLEWLSLSGTELTGPIPGALGRLVNLRGLELNSNHLSGPIPPALGNLVNLEELYLQGNDLTGPVPASLGNLAQLRWLALDGNELTGRIPGALGSLANLELLSLDGNELTGSIPGALGSLASLERLSLGGNELTGRIPSALGSLANLRQLDLSRNDLTGAIPSELGSLTNLERLDLSYNWGLSGPLPAGLEQSALEELDIFVTQTCAPPAWDEWLATIEFWGPACGAGPGVTIDIAVVYTPAAREASGGVAGIEAEIDLWIAETNQAYAASGVDLRLALVDRSEVAYTEIDPDDIYRLADPSDGHLDEVHALRDDVGADLVHLIVSYSVDYGVCGKAAGIPSVFGFTVLDCGGIVFAHELGHNLGLRHDRFRVQLVEGGVLSHPAFGYVNQRMFGAGAPPSSRWVTIMSYPTQCGLADARCSWVPRFSNPRLRYADDPLGVAFGVGSGVTGAADAAAVLNATGPAVAAWRDRPDRPNRPPAAVGTLPDRRLESGGTLDLDVSQVFRDPDGDPLTYVVSSSAASVVTVRALGPRVTLTAVGEGAATIRVTATDPWGLSAAQSFAVTVERPNQPPEAVGTLPDRTLELDATLDVDVSPGFVDPDGDALTYTVTSSAPQVATVRVAGARVTLRAVGEGAAVIRVTATDPGGLRAAQSFAVTVERPNQPPASVGTLPDRTLELDATLDVNVSPGFVDPDGDALTYTVTSSAPQVATARVAGARVTLRAVGEGAAVIEVTATDPGGLSAAQSFAVTVERSNQPPEAVETLPDVRLPDLRATLDVDVSPAFVDADGDALTYMVSSLAPQVATARVAGARVTLTAVGIGRAVIEVTATDPDGLSATQLFGVRVSPPFTDDPIRSGVTPIKAVHFTELRARIDILRGEAGLGPFRWTDRVLRAGVTRVRLTHLLELRDALAAAYAAAGRAAPRWTDAAPAGGTTPIRAAHLTELRAAVIALEQGR